MANQTQNNSSSSTTKTPSTTTTTTTTTMSNNSTSTSANSINLPTVVVTTATQQQQAAAAAAQNLLLNISANSSQNAALLQNTTAILDVVLCKLNTSYHIINDPRILDCGHSACLSCIIQLKDTDKNLKCNYCNSIHKIPLDTNKLTVNKNLQTFIKYNFKQNLNQNFLKQFDDSMTSLEGNYNISTKVTGIQSIVKAHHYDY
jgi:transcription elongation factor Elf1